MPSYHQQRRSPLPRPDVWLSVALESGYTKNCPMTRWTDIQELKKRLMSSSFHSKCPIYAPSTDHVTTEVHFQFPDREIALSACCQLHLISNCCDQLLTHMPDTPLRIIDVSPSGPHFKPFFHPSMSTLGYGPYCVRLVTI